jgi:aminoglycoside phosphotransferase (APT) family kinase protein
MEPYLLALLEAKHARQGKGSYKPREAQDVGERLRHLLHAHGVPGTVCNVHRMGGGASKEQFLFDLVDEAHAESRQLVLRMDPLEGIIETSREREAQVLAAVGEYVPVPKVAWVDPDGTYMGQPAMVAHFVSGVTKPSGDGGGPSGLGTKIGEKLGNALTPQYVRNLALVHGIDFRRHDLSTYGVPAPGSEVALWQLNFWSRVLADDGIDAVPVLNYAQYWLRQNLPLCARPMLLHGDYRLGNYMFDEASMEITAILDWELAHIGDYHEDVAYSLEPLFCSADADGSSLVSSIMSVEKFLGLYTEMSGNPINRDTLHWYRVLNGYKLAVMNLSSSIRAARDGTNHQCAFLSYLSASGVGIAATLGKLLTGKIR